MKFYLGMHALTHKFANIRLGFTVLACALHATLNLITFNPDRQEKPLKKELHHEKNGFYVNTHRDANDNTCSHNGSKLES